MVDPDGRRLQLEGARCWDGTRFRVLDRAAVAAFLSDAVNVGTFLCLAHDGEAGGTRCLAREAGRVGRGLRAQLGEVEV